MKPPETMSLYIAGDTCIERESTLRFDFENLSPAQREKVVRGWRRLANGRRFWLNLTPEGGAKRPSRIVTHAELETLLVPGGRLRAP